MFRSRKWHEEEAEEDAADEVNKKWEPGVKIGSETDVEQTEKGPERERGRKEKEKKEFNAQSKWSEIWFLKKMLRRRADIFQHFCFV